MGVGISSRINSERAVLLGWSRAILLQLAHPLIAAGVADHSSFRAGRLTAALRLHQTIRAMLSLTFGDVSAREATLATINGIHRRVHGVLRESAGPFPLGTRYSAEDPELLQWVHATLLDSIPLLYERLVRPLTDEERDQYCREAAPIVRALGADRGVPETWSALRSYMDRMYGSGHLVVSDEARSMAASVLAPPFAPLLGPVAHVNRLFTVGLLPPQVREQYGFGWNARQERALARWTRLLRATRRLMPERVALWPEARRSERRVASGGDAPEGASLRS